MPTATKPAAKKTRTPRFTDDQIKAATRSLKANKPVKVEPHPIAQTGALRTPTCVPTTQSST